MFKEQRECLISHLGSYVQFTGNGWQLSNSQNQLLKVALVRGAWLLMTVTLLHYVFHYHISHLTEPSIPTHPLLAASDWDFLLPWKIWQVYLTSPNFNNLNSNIDPTQISDIASWLAHNPKYKYILVGDKGAEALVLQQFKESPTLVRIFQELKSTSMKSDLLRYLILSIKGGVYADINTVNLKLLHHYSCFAWAMERNAFFM